MFAQRWRQLVRVAALLAALVPAVARAQCYKFNGGCSTYPQQCFPSAAGPTLYFDGSASQIRIAADSPESTCHPPVTFGPPACCSSPPPASSQPRLSNLRAVLVKNAGNTDTYAVSVDYDAPNFYCTSTGDWPPGGTCFNDPLAESDHLVLYLGSATSPVDVLARSFIYFENGTWTTNVTVGCGESKGVSAQITYLTTAGLFSPAEAHTELINVTGPPCSDRRMCPVGAGGAAAGAGRPINAGSGDVTLTVPFFTLAQSPLSLGFGLSYHSEMPRYPALVASPAGLGWTHPYAQTLRPVDAVASSLYHLTAEGYESEYVRQADGSWIAASPGELRGRVVAAGGQYQLTDLDGTTTAFDAATGVWLSTTDRWGNALQGGFDGQGNLVSVTDAEGRQIQLAYSGGQLAQVTLPGGESWRLGYQGNVLTELFDPLHTGSQPWRTFGYVTDSQGVVRLLSAARDEAGYLLEGHAYDLLDRGVSSVSEGGRDQVSFEYATPAGGQTRVTHAIDGVTSQVSVFTLTYGKGRYLPTEILGDCPTCGGATSDDQHFTYTNDNHVASRTDGRGFITQYAYNGDGNVTARTEALDTAQQRTTTYLYGYAPWPNFVTEVDEPSAAKPGVEKVTTFSWNTSGTPETVLTTAEAGYLLAGDASPTVYATTRTFDARHRLLSVAGPRTDVVQVTTQRYYADTDATPNRRGRLQSVTDPSGNVSTFDNYDEFGTARTAVDPNGVVNMRQTDARGRVVASTSRAVAGVAGEASDYTTTFTFDGRDRLVKMVQPRGNGMAYGYENGTNRPLDTIRLDAAGNQLERHHLTLNVIGDKVMEEDQGCAAPAPACGAWTTTRSESFAYDVYNRLAGVLHPVPAGSRTFNTYDLDGQLSTVQDEDHASTNAIYSYDALHRMISVRQTLASAPGGAATTAYSYDVMDNLSSVTDPNGNTTSYRYDDFHRLERQDSPVTGTTIYQYDPAGNLVATTDARGASTARNYDASNRVLTSTSQLAGVPAETVTYSYDSAAAGSFGRGRLAQMTDPSGATAYAYERRGLLKSEARTILGSAYGTAFQYDANGNRGGMTYPSGRQVAYGFDFADRPFSAASGTTTFVASASYLPFGPEAQLVFGNGTTQTRSYDLRYRPVENRLAGSAAPIADYLYGEDPAGNITSIHDALDATFNRDFAYDDLFRLTGAATGAALWGPGGYQYDAMGNMTALALGSSRSAAFSYNGTLPTLSSVVENGVARTVSYDPAGNEVAVGSGTFTYSPRNLLAAGDGLAYTYDGRGVRVAVQVVAAFGTITGTVTDQNGQPLAGATVQITGTVNATATDGAGNFNLTAPAGLSTLTVSKFGFLPATTTPFTLAAGGSFAAGTIHLQPAPGKINGTVVTSLDGSPLAGAAVSLAENGDTAFADASGNFTLTEPAGTYTPTIAAAGYASQSLPSFALAAGATHPLGTITLVANPATLSGHVTSSAGGASIAGATVTATSLAGAAPHAAPAGSRPGQAPPVHPAQGVSPASTFTATTDASGNFTFQLPPATYSVTVTAAGFGSRTTSAVNLGPGAVFSFGTLTLDPLGTITGTVIQASGGAPIQGATVAIVGTLNQTITDANGRFSLIQSAGTYQLAVSAAGFLTATVGPLALAPGATLSAGTIELSQQALAVYVAYADSLRPSGAFPIPWQGSPNTVFLGGSGPFDAGAVRLDNATDQPLQVDDVIVDLQRPNTSAFQFLPPPVFDLWGSFIVPAHGTVILTQQTFPDFDTSDYPIVDCGQTVSPFDPRVPKVTLTMGGVATAYFDTAHVLDTGGADRFYCVAGGNEALPWRLIGTTGVQASGAFQLLPLTSATPAGTPASLTAVLTDASGQPLPNVSVHFSVTAGPNHGISGQAVTDATGRAPFRYTGTVVGTDTVQASFTNATGVTLKSNLATVVWESPYGLAVFVGYADNTRPHPAFPVPWQGDPNVLFIGGAPPFDAGAVRLDNPGPNPLAVDSVVVDLQRIEPHPVDPRLPPPVFNLWGSFVIPAHGSAILTQTAFINFDTSDYPISGAPVFFCIAPDPNDPQIPKITVTIGGQPASYLDTAHIIDTFGVDRNACGHANESLQWRLVNTSASDSAGQLALLPAAAANPLGALYTATAVATDAGGSPLAGVTVLFTVASGPNAGLTSQAVTSAAGVATFSYTGTTAGTDTLSASITNASGGLIQSSSVTALWLPTVQLALSPPSATQAVGTPYNATLLATDGSNQPVAGLTVTFRIASGPNAGKTAQQTTGANGQTLYSYTSATAGTDTLTASIGLQGGNSLSATPVTATWTSSSTSGLVLAPLSQSLPVGTAAGLTATLLGGNQQPIANQAVTFTVTSGPDAGTTGQATTNAAGVAAFSFTGLTQGSDLVHATTGQGGGMLTSNPATIVWTAVPTAVLYTGPSFGEFGDPLILTARLTAATTGQPLAGQTLGFTFGTQTLTGVTDATGTATVTLTPTMNPGAVPLSIVFAGSVGYGGSAASVLVAIHRDDTALVYTGPAGVATGQPQTVTAVLTDAQSHAPLAGKTVTFTFGSVTASGTTDATGTATTTLTLPTSPTGPAVLQVAFAGDAGELPAATTAPVVVYQPASFVLWGGNTPGLALGQYVNFWGSQWASQVTGGDYQANPSFKGFAIPAASPIAICEPTAHTSSSPQLDASCWTSKPGNSKPPATLSAYIGVIVSTSIAKQGSTIYGNVAALVVVQVDPGSPYGSDPGHPGFGTVAAVIQDGAGLFPHAAPRRQLAPAGETSSRSQTGAGEVMANPAPGQPVAQAAVAAGNRRFFFYSPELHLLAESELTTSASPAILNEYIWFHGHPLAQSDATGATSWTFTDHLGTPILQTSAAQGVTWRAEYEPYGAVFALRSPDQHQPLRLPGQEAEQLSLGANGATKRSYNVYRWYEPGIGRYDEPDPLRREVGTRPYNYARSNPLLLIDRKGLKACSKCDQCPCGVWIASSVEAESMVFIGQIVAFVSYQCTCSPWSCRGLSVAPEAGFGAVASLGASVGTAVGACNKGDLESWSVLFGATGGALGVGSIEGGSTPQPGGTRYGNVGAGVGVGGATRAIVSNTTLTCSDKVPDYYDWGQRFPSQSTDRL
jgi:RHS repeat-associated protein